jgi:hypothetical protein
MKNYLKQIALLLCTCALVIAPIRHAFAAEFSFKVHNTTKDTIKKLLASEDGKTYGFFDIGKGIKAGETATLEWDKSTDDGKCKQWFKAVFADGEESEAVQFDFCEDDLTLEF